MWMDEHVVKKMLCVLPRQLFFFLKKGRSEETCYIATQLLAAGSKSQDATTAAASPYCTSTYAQTLFRKVHITGHGGPDGE
jgi:hypothetical protein